MINKPLLELAEREALKAEVTRLTQQLAATIAERDRAVKALAFYADERNYESRESNCGNLYLANAIDKDSGAQARAAIAAGGEELPAALQPVMPNGSWKVEEKEDDYYRGRDID